MVELDLTQLIRGNSETIFLHLTRLIHGNSIDTDIQMDGHTDRQTDGIHSSLYLLVGQGLHTVPIASTLKLIRECLSLHFHSFFKEPLHSAPLNYLVSSIYIGLTIPLLKNIILP